MRAHLTIVLMVASWAPACAEDVAPAPIVDLEDSTELRFNAASIQWDFQDLHGMITDGGAGLFDEEPWGLTGAFFGYLYDEQGEITEVFSGDAEVLEWTLGDTGETAGGWPVYEVRLRLGLQGYDGELAEEGHIYYDSEEEGYHRFHFEGLLHFEAYGQEVDCEAWIPCTGDGVDGVMSSTWSAVDLAPTPTPTP